MSVYGKELAAVLRADVERIKGILEDRQDRIDKGMTDMDDCFMSQRNNENSLQRLRMQLEILETDGLMEVDVVDLGDGEVEEPRWVETRWGSKIVAHGVFAASLKALLKKTGWTLTPRLVPMWVKFYASGTGMAGAFNGSYQVCRWHTNMVTGEYFGFDRYDPVEEGDSSDSSNSR